MATHKELERTLKAVGNKRRLAIVGFLKNKKAGANVGDIAEAIKLSYKSTSHHLRMMASAGILLREQTSVDAVFTLAQSSDPVLRALFAQL